ncbi:hypothetical protein ACLOJK_032371 [Asimina triloba]
MVERATRSRQRDEGLLVEQTPHGVHYMIENTCRAWSRLHGGASYMTASSHGFYEGFQLDHSLVVDGNTSVAISKVSTSSAPLPHRPIAVSLADPNAGIEVHVNIPVEFLDSLTLPLRFMLVDPTTQPKPYASSKRNQPLPQIACPSRREAILCLTTSLAANALFATQPATAQVVSLDITQTIIEKFQELFGLSKAKTESRPSNGVEKPLENKKDQTINMLELLKDKAGVPKPNSGSGSNGVEVQKPPVARSDAPLDVVEKFKEMVGGSKPKTDSVSIAGEMKLPVNQNDQPKDAMDNKLGKSSSTGGGKQP